jgi:antitoxin VapB
MLQSKRNASLNVKDPEAHRLAQAIAKATGETITRAVTEALRERYDRLRNRRDKATMEELVTIAKRSSAQVKRPYLDHADLLYDERGLPR